MSSQTNAVEAQNQDQSAQAEKGAAPAGQMSKDAKNGGGVELDPGMKALSHVPVEIQVVLGTARMSIGNILNLGRGAVVEIDRKVGEQVDIQINHRPVARGEIIIVDEDRLGVTLTEIINIQAGLR
ncbi:flagellar motor switch protein FliN [Hyphococcus sp.]|jgi:flagellar motor switch protein FliN/FliY|uniref:flagellar motor switch protein FliN n=1 Tax=Hyphococcus sp. TaxID=2038636 RepID=UPI003D12B86A